MDAHCRAHLLFGVGKQLADVLLTRADELVQDLRAVHNLRLARVEHLADLPRHERLARAGRAEEQDALDVLDAQLLHERGREDARRKGAAEDGAELVVETANAHVLELEVRLQDGVWRRAGPGRT